MRKSLLLIMILGLAAGAWFVWPHTGEKRDSGSRQTPTFDKQQFSLDDPTSIWVIANKHRPLQPTNYAPADLVVPNIPLRLSAKSEEMQLRTTAARALEAMYKDAQQADLKLMVASAYRSYAYQRGLYNGYVNRQGQAEADTQSARPGHSEHQTGWAVDVEPSNRMCEVEACFADTPEGQWVAANAYRYGFVIRYPKDKQAVTGYVYEPWHLRYVGPALAEALHKQSNPTLEEFFGLEAAPGYR